MISQSGTKIRTAVFLATFVFALSMPIDVCAQRNLREIPPPDPQHELASFKVADGLEVNLWAADPLLAKPTQISFDREGRLWASTSETYPQLNVNQEPQDRIIVLEDRDRDGVADHSSVFYDELIIPGGVLPDGQGGAYVAHAEQLIHIADTDQDGRGDKKTVLLSGFGTEDTHHTLHRLRWGPDGLMYMLQGYYIGTHVETLYGPRRLNGGGLWSYDTRTRRLEIYSRGLVNPWGIRFDRWGQTFQTDGAGGDGINYSFPDSVFKASPLENRFLTGLNPRRPKSCGLEVISGDHFPSKMHGNLLTADFRANNIDRYVIEEDRSGYTSTLQDDVLKSSHVSFRPIDIVMGPDGAIYIADWYSPIIQHGEVDFRDERRDHVHGRIWRITAKGRPLVEPIDYASQSIPQLLDLLKSDADWIRLHAKQELKHRDEATVVTSIDRWLEQLDTSDSNYEHHCLEALWAYQTVSTQRSPSLSHRLLNSPDHRVRAAAVRSLYYWGESLEPLEKAVQDPHPRVRREAVTALGQVKSPEAVQLALAVLDYPRDEWIDFALWRTCRILAPVWLPAFQRGELTFNGNADQMAFALAAVERADVLKPLIDLVRKGQSHDPAVIRLIGKIGETDDLELLTSLILSDSPLQSHAAAALLEAVRDRGMQPAQDLSVVCRKLFASDSVEITSTTCRLVGYWKQSSFSDDLHDHLTSANSSFVLRQAAAQGLANLALTVWLEKLAGNPASSVEVRVAAVSAMTAVEPGDGAKRVVAMLNDELTEEQVELLIAPLLVKRDGTQSLKKQLRKLETIPSAVATQISRLVETSATSDAELLAVLARVGKLATIVQKLDPNELQRLVGNVRNGNAQRGQQIFQRKALECAKCHRVKGTGGDIGPDLSSIGAAAPLDYLIESLIEPSKKVKEGYRMSVIVTDDGDVYSGLVAAEDERVVVLRNSTGKEERIPKPKIESRTTSPNSLMPSGLTASLREGEFLDLIAYLSTLGKQ